MLKSKRYLSEQLISGTKQTSMIYNDVNQMSNSLLVKATFDNDPSTQSAPNNPRRQLNYTEYETTLHEKIRSALNDLIHSYPILKTNTNVQLCNFFQYSNFLNKN